MSQLQRINLGVAVAVLIVVGTSKVSAVTISGKVYDENNKLLSGVYVRAFAHDGRRIAETYTNTEGKYKFDITIKLPINLIEYDRQGYFSGTEVNISHLEPSVINKVVYTNPEGPLSFRTAYAVSLGLRMIIVLRGGAPKEDWLENLKKESPKRFELVKTSRQMLVEDLERIEDQLTKLERLAKQQSNAGAWSMSEHGMFLNSIRTARAMARDIRKP